MHQKDTKPPSDEVRRENQKPMMNLPKFCPQPPSGLDKTGLPRGLLFELVLKQVFLDGTTTLMRLIGTTKLDYPTIEAVFRSMQREQLLNVKGVEGYDYEFGLTAKG